MKIAVVRESAQDERRVAATPETIGKFIALGAEVAVEAGAGLGASIDDAAYAEAGATLGDRTSVIAGADLILAVQGPEPASLGGAKPGAWLVGALNPFVERARIDGLCRSRAGSAGDGIHAAHHARADDGRAVVAVQPRRL